MNNITKEKMGSFFSLFLVEVGKKDVYGPIKELKDSQNGSCSGNHSTLIEPEMSSETTEKGGYTALVNKAQAAYEH